MNSYQAKGFPVKREAFCCILHIWEIKKDDKSDGVIVKYEFIYVSK